MTIPEAAEPTAAEDTTMTAKGDFKRGGTVVLSNGRSGYIVGYDGSDFVKVQTIGGNAAERPIVKAKRA
jgi:hypothetical protein